MAVLNKVFGALARAVSPGKDAYLHLRRGEYELAVAEFSERLKKRKDATAMHYMGWLAENGHVVDATPESADNWYQEAVNHGRHASALALSDSAYRAGRFKEAHDWADYALRKKVPGAKEMRDRAMRAAGLNLQWWR